MSSAAIAKPKLIRPRPTGRHVIARAGRASQGQGTQGQQNLVAHQIASTDAAVSLERPSSSSGLVVGAAIAAAAVGAAVGSFAQKKLSPKPKADEPFALGMPSVDKMPQDADEVADNIGYHAKYTASTAPLKFTTPQAYLATAQSVSERLVERWDATFNSFETENPKMAYYLSMEYLHGRTLSNAVRNIGMKGEYESALLKFGHKLEEVEFEESDAGLGNGGL